MPHPDTIATRKTNSFRSLIPETDPKRSTKRALSDPGVFFWCSNYRQTMYLMVSFVIIIRALVFLFLINVFYKQFFVRSLLHLLNLLFAFSLLFSVIGLSLFFRYRKQTTVLHRVFFLYDSFAVFSIVISVNYFWVIELMGLLMQRRVQHRASALAESMTGMLAFVLPFEIVNLIILYHHKKAVKFPLRL